MNPAGPTITKEILLDAHEISLLQRMNNLRKKNPEESFCDVSFKIGDEEFHCHKLVLISASPYFETMFNGDYRERSCKNIAIEGIEPEAFEEILTAIYTSRLIVTANNAYFILQASHMLLLTNIFEAVVHHIIEDTNIDYLIETCAFVRKVEQKDLYRKCISAIASDLNDLSKTNVFLKKENEAIMTFDIFLDILSDGNLIGDDEALLQIISKWCYSNKCIKDKVTQLLNSADLKSGCMNTQNLARYIVQNYSDSEFGQITSIAKHCTKIGSEKRNSANRKSKVINYNVYLNTVDVETGTKGWGLLQSKNEFKEFEAINYICTHWGPAERKVIQIENKLYCYEFDCRLNHTFFYYLENDKKTYLNLPSTSAKSWYFDMEKVGNAIYLITEHEQLWKYDLEISKWTNVYLQLENFDSRTRLTTGKRPYDLTVNSSPKLTQYKGILYIVGLCEKNILRIFPNQPVSYQNRIIYSNKIANPGVCCYENNLVISGSNHDGNLHKNVSAYDMRANQWHTLKNMNTGRANHSLTYHDGFLYAIESRASVPNEKYDTRVDEWIEFPPLPERFSIIQNHSIVELATSEVFNCFIK